MLRELFLEHFFRPSAGGLWLVLSAEGVRFDCSIRLRPGKDSPPVHNLPGIGSELSRYLVPVVGDPTRSEHLAAACQRAARDGAQVVALVIGLVPRSLPM